MGKGKGVPEYWVAVVQPGRIMFEADGVPAGNSAGSYASGCGKITC